MRRLPACLIRGEQHGCQCQSAIDIRRPAHFAAACNVQPPGSCSENPHTWPAPSGQDCGCGKRHVNFYLKAVDSGFDWLVNKIYHVKDLASHGFG